MPNLAIPAHCTPTTPFLASLSAHVGTCIPMPLAFLSTLLGTLSIISWLFAQMPQIYKNYKIQSTAGLSIFLLAEWLLGDVANLLGALFTNQATWQLVIASYYLMMDLCLVAQYFWYTHFKPRMYESSLHSDARSDELGDDCNSINALSPINASFAADSPNALRRDSAKAADQRSIPNEVPHFSLVNYEKHNTSSMNSCFPSPSPRTLLYATTLSLASRATAYPLPSQSHLYNIPTTSPSTLEIIGTILSWTSCLLYLFSRFPQLYLNYVRKSTTGLSPLLFLAAFCGNLFYSTSVISNPNAWSDFPPYGGYGWADSNGNDRFEWVKRAAPFFLGAAGVLFLDMLMGVQFLLYGEENVEKIVKVRDKDGYSHWERVNGWMRGWIPTVAGKEKVVDLQESQRLLAGSRRTSIGYGT